MQDNFEIKKVIPSSRNERKAEMFINLNLAGISGSIPLYADKHAESIKSIRTNGLDNPAVIEFLTKKLVISSIRESTPSEVGNNLFDDFQPDIVQL